MGATPMMSSKFFEAVKELVIFVTQAPCCGKPDPTYQPLTPDDHVAVIECHCGATWATNTGSEIFMMTASLNKGKDGGWSVYTI